MPHRTFICQLLFCAIFSVSLINIFTKASSLSFSRNTAGSPTFSSQGHYSCPTSDLLDDILVVLRTGASESLEKVPVHFRTTLQCVPNYVIFSDMDEEIEGHQVEDVLGGVTAKTKYEHQDFRHYHQLQEHGRSKLKNQQVITAMSGSVKGDYLQTDNPGWQLDKWKFLPMIDRALEKKPDAKWFVFLEADTFLGLNNMLEYLSNFDETKSYYIGKHLYISDVEFGYGGAGFVMSNPAIRKVSEHHSTRIEQYEEFTKTHWVGECALGKVFEDVHVPLHRAFPHLQSDSPASLDPATNKIDRDLWCYPAISYHHVSPAEIEELWQFEQDWYHSHDSDILLRHRDIFRDMIRPKLASSIQEWDNMADKEYNAHDHASSENIYERNAWKSFDHCRSLCDEKDDCVQFSFDAGSCSISSTLRLGYARPGERIRSGWMLDRVDDLFRNLDDKCGIRDWFAPHENKSKNEEQANSELKMRRKRSVPAAL